VEFLYEGFMEHMLKVFLENYDNTKSGCIKLSSVRDMVNYLQNHHGVPNAYIEKILDGWVDGRYNITEVLNNKAVLDLIESVRNEIFDSREQSPVIKGHLTLIENKKK
jgi:hypothetical protein